MKKFAAIEGLRGWLAWAVVLDHLASTTGIDERGIGRQLVIAGQNAVLIFIIISGFVITHLVTVKPEPYAPYLIRRFMRIFPLFAVTCIVGYFTTDLYAQTIATVSWASDPHFAAARVAEYAGISASDHQFFRANFLAHLVMLHGAIGNNVLPFSQLAFNGPAWSISLEWQFYLIAPFIVGFVRRLSGIVWLALIVCAFQLAYERGLLGAFGPPSFLPGAAAYFAIGIFSRLAYPRIAETLEHPTAVLALVLVLLPLGWVAVPILVWGLVMAGLCLTRSQAQVPFARFYHHMLEGRFASYFGSRSYSVYLCHFPIIALCLAFWVSKFPTAGRYATLGGLAVMVVPSTLIAAELLYRLVERQGIALGSRLAGRFSRPQLATAP